jgi:hypothetical protein
MRFVSSAPRSPSTTIWRYRMAVGSWPHWVLVTDIGVVPGPGG